MGRSPWAPRAHSRPAASQPSGAPPRPTAPPPALAIRGAARGLFSVRFVEASRSFPETKARPRWQPPRPAAGRSPAEERRGPRAEAPAAARGRAAGPAAPDRLRTSRPSGPPSLCAAAATWQRGARTKPRAKAAPNRSAGAAPLASGPGPPLLRPGRRRASARERRAAPSPRREVPVSGRGGRPCCFHHAPAGPQEGRAATQRSLPNFGNFPGRSRPKPGTGSPPAGPEPEPPPSDGSGKATAGGGTRLEPERWRRLPQKPGAAAMIRIGSRIWLSRTARLAPMLHAFRAPWLSRRPSWGSPQPRAAASLGLGLWQLGKGPKGNRHGSGTSPVGSLP